jgi:hypothetical protein
VRHPKGTYAGLGLTEMSIKMTDQTIVLVDKYGELWTLDIYEFKDRPNPFEYFILKSNTEYFIIYRKIVSHALIKGMGMEVLGEL